MKRTPKSVSNRSLFNSGLALTAGIALTVNSYAFAKNAFINELLYYALALIVITFAGLGISYFAYRHLSNTLDLSIGFIIVTYSVIAIELSLLLLREFIHFHVPYGYFLLPVAIDVAGALVLLTIVSILQFKSNDIVKMGAVMCLIVATSAALLFIK
jgi:hypothetical protein